MSGTDERLVTMARQIARNFAVRGEEQAAAALADHIASFWDRRSRERLFAMEEGTGGPVVARAIARLRAGGVPPHQTLATAEEGGSDAG